MERRAKKCGKPDLGGISANSDAVPIPGEMPVIMEVFCGLYGGLTAAALLHFASKNTNWPIFATVIEASKIGRVALMCYGDPRCPHQHDAPVLDPSPSRCQTASRR